MLTFALFYPAELSTQKSTDSLDFLNLPATLPRLNTDAGRFRSSIGAKGGLANRRKPTRALVRQAYNKKESASDDDIFGAESEVSFEAHNSNTLSLSYFFLIKPIYWVQSE